MFKYSNSKDWFEIIKQKDYLYVIRERLNEIDPRFYTIFINLYLILGTHSALLIDTGLGLFPIKPIISNLILDKKLIVIKILILTILEEIMSLMEFSFIRKNGKNSLNPMIFHS